MGDANANVVVPGGQITIATPGFDGSAPVPSFGQSAATPDPSMQVNNMAKQIMARLAQASQRKQFAGTPVPSAVPGMQDPNAARKIGMDTANPNAWGKQRLMAGIATNIQNAVAKQKQQKLLKAEADWTYMGSAINELEAAKVSNDPKAVAAAQQKVDIVMGDPKKLKEMAKALNQDWLNPEKTTVYGDALKKVTAKAGQDAQQKADQQKAATGLKGLFQKLMQKNQQPQLTPEQQKAMSAEILAKAPTATAGMSPDDQLKFAKGILDIEQASKAARNKYDVKVGPDGTAWAYNTTDPTDAFKLTDHKTGEELKGPVKASTAPKVVSNGTVPYAIQRDGKLVTPRSKDWTKADQEQMDAAINASDEKQQNKVPTVVVDEIGPGPNPENYRGGRSDPAFITARKAWGEMAEGIINRMAGARARAGAESRYVQVTDPDRPGEFIYKPVGQAARDKSSSAQSASGTVPKKVLEWATTGKGGEEINAFNTALQHADLLKEAAIRLQNGDTRWLNEKKNEFKSAFGDPNLTSARAIANAYSREVTKMLSSGHMTDSEIGSAEATLPLDANIETIEGVLDAYKALAGSKMQQRYNQYQQGLQAKPNFPAGTGSAKEKDPLGIF